MLAIPGKAREKCIFDTEKQEEVLIKLKNKYRGSKLIIEQRTLKVAWDKGTIKYQRGGCNHFGENI